MEIQQVRAFVAAARTGGFGRAGAALGLAQPTISVAIRRLEEDLRVQLFERLGRSIRLTAAGRALFGAAEPLLRQWERLPAALTDAMGGELDEPVRVGVGVFSVMHLLPRVFQTWRGLHPRARLIIRTHSFDDTVAMLRTGDLDLGWRGLPTPLPGIFFKPLATFDRVLISAHSHPITRARTITLSRLAEHPFVNARGRSTTWCEVERAFQAANLPCRIALEADGLEVIKRYVALGAGIAVIPACCIEPRDRARLAVRSVQHLFGRDRFGVLVRRGRPLSRAAREFVRLIDPEFPEEVA